MNPPTNKLAPAGIFRAKANSDSVGFTNTTISGLLSKIRFSQSQKVNGYYENYVTCANSAQSLQRA
jgi:hypothetical protein